MSRSSICLIFVAGQMTALVNGRERFSSKLDCRWSVNLHNYSWVYSALDASLREKLPQTVVSVYGLQYDASKPLAFISHPMDLFAPNTSDWEIAWGHAITTAPKEMARIAIQALNGTTDGILMLDYEPHYRPTWNFTTTEKPENTQPEWSAFVAHVHNASFDLRWTNLVGWIVPDGAQRWKDLSSVQRISLLQTSWDWFCRKYLSSGIDAIRAALPQTFELAFWNFPFKFWTLPRGGRDEWNAMMDEMAWLWARLDVLLPDLYPEFYAGPVNTRPAVLSTCTVQNATTTHAYYQANVDSAVRLRSLYNPAAKVYLSLWWHYMCARVTSTAAAYFVHDGNLHGPFTAVGHDGILLWGSVGSYPGEDANASVVVDYLNTVWAPLVQQYCRAPGP
eukprot:m.899381 g.899381  ORF g.899381 m.899381 type:complete len:392 (+) comp23680_c0_seq6:134-1309(+)